MNDLTNAKIGMKVEVFDIDNKFLGLGTIIKLEPLTLEETGEILSNNFPTIKLDSGDELTGLECWWHPV